MSSSWHGARQSMGCHCVWHRKKANHDTAQHGMARHESDELSESNNLVYRLFVADMIAAHHALGEFFFISFMF